MPLPSLATLDAASRRRSREISQGDREIGSYLGFAHRTLAFSATEATTDRWGGVRNQDSWSLSERVIAACIEVHRVLGPGLLESMYEASLCEELALRGIAFERQKAVAVVYKGRQLEQGYRTDLIIQEKLLVEIKAVEVLLPVHAAQVITYLQLAGIDDGLLVNFNGLSRRHGLRRLSRTPKNSRSPDLPAKKSRLP
jgi:GxxExxY protein